MVQLRLRDFCGRCIRTSVLHPIEDSTFCLMFAVKHIFSFRMCSIHSVRLWSDLREI